MVVTTSNGHSAVEMMVVVENGGPVETHVPLQMSGGEGVPSPQTSRL